MKQAGQQLGIIYIGAVRRITVAAGAGMHPDPHKFFRGKTGECEVIQVNKTVEEFSGGVKFYRQPPFCEVDLNLMRTPLETTANLRLMFAMNSSRE